MEKQLEIQLTFLNTSTLNKNSTSLFNDSERLIMNGRLTREEILKIGFASVGNDVSISDTAKFYGASNMRIGNHVRIDDYSVFVGSITIGDYIHIGAFASLHASSGSIVIDNFSGLSSRVTIYAASDDFSGDFLLSNGVPNSYKNVISSNIVVQKYCHIGTGSTLLPGATLLEGSSIGAMSLVKECTEPWHIYAGIPCRKIKKRSTNEKELAELFLKNRE